MVNSFRMKSILFMIMIGLLLTFTACTKDAESANDGTEAETETGGNDTEAEAADEGEDSEPVTITLVVPLGEEFIQGRFGAIEEKLDNINLEFITGGGSVEALEELYAAQVYPDIIVSDYAPVKELGVDYPLDDLIEKHNFDLDTIDESLNSFMRSLGDDGEYVGFPDGTSFWGLYYNKEIFDVLGQDYPDPEVPMTWDEVIDLAKQMTTEMGGHQYYGLTGGDWDSTRTICLK